MSTPVCYVDFIFYRSHPNKDIDGIHLPRLKVSMISEEVINALNLIGTDVYLCTVGHLKNHVIGVVLSFNRQHCKKNQQKR